MGKRKKSSRKPTGPRKREPLATQFTCLFCNHEKAISVKLEKKMGIGSLSCKVCGQRFQTGINYLSAAVDVYSDWIDACDAVAKEAAEQDDADKKLAKEAAEEDDADKKFSSYATTGDKAGAATAGEDDDGDAAFEEED